MLKFKKITIEYLNEDRKPVLKLLSHLVDQNALKDLYAS